MNKRIKELADQLGPVGTIGNWGRVIWADEVYPQLGDKMYAAIDLQKFAELIVRECADFADEHNDYSEGVTLGVGQALKKHFGVEE
jgi:hypothetical protein